MRKLGGEFRTNKLLESFAKFSSRETKAVDIASSKTSGDLRSSEDIFISKFHAGTKNLGLDHEIPKNVSRTVKRGLNSNVVYEHSLSDPELDTIEKELDAFSKQFAAPKAKVKNTEVKKAKAVKETKMAGLLMKAFYTRVENSLSDAALNAVRDFRTTGDNFDSIA